MVWKETNRGGETMIWLYIATFSVGMMIGLYYGRRCGIKETHRALHVISSRKAVEDFRKHTGLDGDHGT